MAEGKYSNKRQINLQQAKNNPNVKFNNYEVLQQKYDVKTIHQMDSLLRATGIGYLPVEVKYGAHVSFVPRSDYHFATANPHILENIDTYLENTITNILDHGDMLQVPVEGHHSGEAMESRLNTEDEQIMFTEALSKYSDKVIAACGGTHDDPEFASRLKDTYVSAIKQIYEGFGIPYFPNSLVVEFKVPVINGNVQVGKTSLWCVVMHCSGKPASKKLGSVEKTYDQGLGVIKKFNAYFGKNVCPDFILGGHFHANADCDYMVERNIYDKDGKATGSYMHTIRVRSNATIQDSNSSSFNRSFPDVLIPNFTQYDVHFRINPAYTTNGMNNNPKFIPVVTEFPILNKSGELSMKAKEYMETRKDYNFNEQVKKDYSMTDFKTLYSDFENGLNQ